MLVSSSQFQLLKVPCTRFIFLRTEMSRQVKTECVVMGTEKGSLNRAWRDQEGFLMER